MCKICGNLKHLDIISESIYDIIIILGRNDETDEVSDALTKIKANGQVIEETQNKQ